MLHSREPLAKVSIYLSIQQKKKIVRWLLANCQQKTVEVAGGAAPWQRAFLSLSLTVAFHLVIFCDACREEGDTCCTDSRSLADWSPFAHWRKSLGGRVAPETEHVRCNCSVTRWREEEISLWQTGGAELSDRDSRGRLQLWRVKVRDLVTASLLARQTPPALWALDASKRYEPTILWSVTDTHWVP